MRYRLGRHRRRNLYAQHGPEPSNDDVFVALFEDEHMAKRVCLALNVEEQVDPPAIDSIMHPLAGTATHINRADFGHGPFIPDLVEEENRIRNVPVSMGYSGGGPVPLTPNDECTCGHPAWMHSGHTGYCANDAPADTCVRFERRCSQRFVGRWSNRCTLAANHDEEFHVGDDGRQFSQRYTQQGEKR